MHYLLQKMYWIFFFFSLNMGRDIGKNVIENLSGKYSKKLLADAKQSATELPKTSSKSAIQKTVEATSDLIGIKVANVVAKSYGGIITKV